MVSTHDSQKRRKGVARWDPGTRVYVLYVMIFKACTSGRGLLFPVKTQTSQLVRCMQGTEQKFDLICRPFPTGQVVDGSIQPSLSLVWFILKIKKSV